MFGKRATKGVGSLLWRRSPESTDDLRSEDPVRRGQDSQATGVGGARLLPAGYLAVATEERRKPIFRTAIHGVVLLGLLCSAGWAAGDLEQCSQSGLVAYWPMEGNGVEMVHNISGSLVGNLTFVPGQVGQAASFDGLTAFIDAGTHAELSTFGGTQISFAAWLYRLPDPQSGDPDPNLNLDFQPVINARTNCGEGNWQFYGDVGVYGGVFMSKWYQGDQSMTFATGRLQFGTWSHVVITHDNGTYNFYVNGVFDSEVTDPNIGPFNTALQNVQVGADGCSSLWTGMIDELAVFNVALTAQQVADLYQAGVSGEPLCTADSGWWRAEGDANDSLGDNHGALAGGAWFGIGADGQAFRFDGVDGTVNVPRSPSLDPGAQVTVALWMQGDEDNPMDACCQGLATSDFWGIELAGGAHFFVHTTDNGYMHTSDVNGVAQLSPGAWYHLAGTYDGSALQLYINGHPWGEPRPASGPINPATPAGFFSIGSEEGRTCPDCTYSRYFKGAIDEVLYFDRVLTPGEIANLAGILDNQAPVALPGSLTTRQYNDYTGTLTGSDPEGAALHYFVTAHPPLGHLDLTDSATGEFIFTPWPGMHGSCTFTFAVSDGERVSAPGFVQVTVEQADPPVTVRLIDSWGGGSRAGR